MDKMEKAPKSSLRMSEFNSTANLTDNPGFQSTLTLDGVTEKDDLYNPFEHREVEHPNSDFGSLIHLLKSSLGSGILAMPLAFKNSGLVVGTIGTLVIGFVCTYCVHILVTISRDVCRLARVPSMDFAQTCGAAFRFGPKPLRPWDGAFRLFVDWALVFTYIGASCVYVVLIADSFHEVVGEYYPEDNWDVKIYCALLLVPLVLLGQIRNLKFLVPFSAVANLFLLATLGITLFYIFQMIPAPEDDMLFASVEKFPLFVSTVIFAMEGIGVVMPVENEMANPKRFLGCPGVLNTAMGIVIFLYGIVGFFGYLHFGRCVQGSITATLDPKLIPAQIAKIGIGLAILFTYGLQLYVPLSIIFKHLEPKLPEKFINITHIVLRTLVVAFSVAIAAAVPKLDVLISLVGAIFFSTLGLLVPAVVETVHRWDGRLGWGRWVLFKNILIGLFSILALVSGSYQAISQLVNGETSDETCDEERV